MKVLHTIHTWFWKKVRIRYYILWNVHVYLYALDYMYKCIHIYQNKYIDISLGLMHICKETLQKVGSWSTIKVTFGYFIPLPKAKNIPLLIQFVTFLGWLSDPFKWLSALQLGDQKVTLNLLAFIFSNTKKDISTLRDEHQRRIFATMRLGASEIQQKHSGKRRKQWKMDHLKMFFLSFCFFGCAFGMPVM